MMRKNYKSYKNVKESEENGINRNSSALLLYFSCLVFLFFLSCTEEKVENNGPEEVFQEELTEESCVNFAEYLHQSFADSNVNYLNTYINWEAIEKEVNQNDALRQEVFDTLMSRYDIAKEFVQMTYSGADVRFITYYKEAEEHYIVFRVFDQPQSLHVYEFELSGSNQALYVNDVYDFGSATSITQVLIDEVDFWSGLGENWYTYFEVFLDVEKEFNMLLSSGSLKDAFSLSKQYDETFGGLKKFRRLYGVLCEYSGNSKMIAGYLDDELARIPLTEKGRWLPLFYLRSLTGQYAEALIALSNLENEIGQDVYLDFLKGNIYFEMGDYTSAISYFNQSLSMDNTVVMFHLGKIHSYISQEMYVEAVESLLVMGDAFSLNEVDWNAEFELYPDFLNSPEYDEFVSRLEN